MPLRDHFHPPVSSRRSWDMLHGLWPAVMVQHLVKVLPEGYVAGPSVHLGSPVEIDVATFEEDNRPAASSVALATTATLPAPTHTLVADLFDPDEYEVRVYDVEHDQTLVAAVEVVSPANKDRPDARRAFVAKTAALLRQGVSVSVVDVVTTRQFNLYAELLESIGGSDPALGADPPFLYAATLRGAKDTRRHRPVQVWYHPLAVGRPLPSLPIWLDVDLGVSLDLETTYEETCRTLRIK